jgi:hypothetical protein
MANATPFDSIHDTINPRLAMDRRIEDSLRGPLRWRKVNGQMTSPES